MDTITPCIILDNDTSAIEIIMDHISEFPRLKLNKTFTKPAAALTEISMEKQRQLIFMDIDMPKLSGLDVADGLKDLPHNIIFTTSYPEYAIEAFKVRAKHFLLKPFNLQEFARVVIDVIKEYYSSAKLEHYDHEAFYFRANGERSELTKLLKSDIVYFQGSNNHVHIYTPTDDFSVYMTLKELEDKILENSRFYRVHKSYIVNTDFVKKITGNKINLGKYEVLMASHYKKDFIAYVERNLLRSKRN
ncbi:LytTR family DNA-binding domain-containing protein [Pedobacter aquatilis]|uniref:LytR/AlgR family response regulator transcription factor n=1 Tax=Pedobacter aquatilis TaxID=351343 RepID=UPI00292CFC75|nr:LytTR family DNA-binding domain-containing protein [Pedobacter aquatilis]